MKKIIAANWKMKLSYQESLALAKEYRASRALKTSDKDIIVCPDFISLAAVSGIIAGGTLFLGGQNSAPVLRGAATGEVSPADLKSVGADYVILGHSERRENFREDSFLVAEKIKAALDAGLVPIVCLGEKLIDRQNGETRKYLRAELKRLLGRLKLGAKGRLIIAYEPVWAISGAKDAKAMDPEEADMALSFIKEASLKIMGKKAPVLYGGSVDGANAGAYLKMKNIDGLLVGAASLNLAELEKIC